MKIKIGKKISTLLLVLICVTMVSCKGISSNDTEANYKPMVNIEGVVYGLSEDLYTGGLDSLEKIGEVSFSYNSPKNVSPSAKSGTSNIYEVGTELYKIKDKSGIVVKPKDCGYWLLEKISE